MLCWHILSKASLAWLVQEAPEKVAKWLDPFKDHLNTLKSRSEARPRAPVKQAFRTIQDGIISYLQVTYYQLFRTIRRVEN
jgi:hypothetical protein